MLSYQVRQRYFKKLSTAPFSFPNDFSAVFFFKPLQPFGKSSDDGHTGLRAVAAHVLFNANTGHHYIQSETALQPLEVTIEEPSSRIELRGNELKIFGRAESLTELELFLYSIYFGFPLLLNVEFGDPPVVERVEGTIGGAPYRWELEDWLMECHFTTQDDQERAVCESWERFGILSQDGNARLRAALHYFHVFCRLSRAGHTPWEFLAEGIVNLAKILEVLFPPTGDGKSMEAARTELEKLGYSKEEVERYFVPAIALRNHIDSAHVDLTLFKMSQLRKLQTYTEAAERQFRALLKKVFVETASGRYKLAQYEATGADARATTIIDLLGQNFANQKKGLLSSVG